MSNAKLRRDRAVYLKLNIGYIYLIQHEKHIFCHIYLIRHVTGIRAAINVRSFRNVEGRC